MPFTAAQFFDVFARYNESVWPVQLVLYGLAIVVVTLSAFRGHGGVAKGRVVSAVLALLWAWMGIVYHLLFFRPINPAATIFGALFVIEAGLLLRAGLARTPPRFSARRDRRSAVGWLLIAYALIGYPLLGASLGHRYPASPTFGLPCPTTIFTLGVLVMGRPVPRHLLLVPVAWAIVGGFAALRLGVAEDIGLPVAALLAVVVLARRGRDAVGRRDFAAIGSRR